MITGFEVHNFRAFRDSGVLPIKPLTCLVGRNSSGKSSMLHALMVLRQSLEHSVIGSRVPELNMSGPIADAGTFEDLAYGHNRREPIGFTFYLEIGGDRDRMEAVPSSSLVRIMTPRPAISRYWLPYGLGLQRRNRKTPRRIGTVSIYFLPEPPFGPSLNRLQVSIDGVGRATFTRTSGKQRVQHWRGYFEDLPSQCVEMFFPRAQFFPVFQVRNEEKSGTPTTSSVADFVAYSRMALFDISEFISEAKILGPFRTPPARRYSFSGFGAADTGLSGERAVDLLIAEKLVSPAARHLHTATSFWLKKLALARSVKLKPLAKRSNIFELLVSGAGYSRTVNFADVGFGVSQVLPVLVQALFVRRGGTYIVQQPELHLHPDAQATLADFFIYLASQGLTTIVETHSEYFLTRLRRRLAEGVEPTVIGIPGERIVPSNYIDKKDVAVMYSEIAKSGGSLRELEIGPSFQFEHLPKGFMSQSVDDRVAVLKALRKLPQKSK